jgi:hypothetical protein
MRIHWQCAKLERFAHNDNRRAQRTRADEQFTLIMITLGAAMLSIAIMWLAG